MRGLKITWIGLCLIAGVAFGIALFFIWHARSNPHEITLYGNVDVRQVDMGFRIMGRVDKMPKEEGDFVRKGEFLASIEPVPYADQEKEAIAQLQAIAIALENARHIYQRREELVDEGGVSQEDYENAFSAQKVLEENLLQAQAALSIAQTNMSDTQIYAPADGTILTRIREPGSIALQGEPVYSISIASPVWVRTYIPEPLLGVVKVGMEGEVITDTKHGRSYIGKVGFISPVAEFTPKTVETTQLRTDLVYQIRLYVDNPDWGLKQGMPVTVRLPIGKKAGRLP